MPGIPGRWHIAGGVIARVVADIDRSTLLGLQSRFGDKSVMLVQRSLSNGTGVFLKGLSEENRTKTR